MCCLVNYIASSVKLQPAGQLKDFVIHTFMLRVTSRAAFQYATKIVNFKEISFPLLFNAGGHSQSPNELHCFS